MHERADEDNTDQLIYNIQSNVAPSSTLVSKEGPQTTQDSNWGTLEKTSPIYVHQTLMFVLQKCG